MPLRACPIVSERFFVSLCVQRRWASLSSPSFAAAANSFKAGATRAIPFAKAGGGGGSEGTVLGWRPSPKLMKNPIFRFLFHNAIPIATYQLFLEFALTAIFGLMIYNGYTTPAGIVKKLEEWHYPLMSWISLEDCTYTEEIPVGPRTLKPEKLTAGHTAHNIASGLLPLQVVVLILTYPFVMRVYKAALCLTKSGKAAAAAAAAAERSAKEAAHRAALASKTEAAASGQLKRRPSYVRPATSHR